MDTAVTQGRIQVSLLLTVRIRQAAATLGLTQAGERDMICVACECRGVLDHACAPIWSAIDTQWWKLFDVSRLRLRSPSQLAHTRLAAVPKVVPRAGVLGLRRRAAVVWRTLELMCARGPALGLRMSLSQRAANGRGVRGPEVGVGPHLLRRRVLLCLGRTRQQRKFAGEAIGSVSPAIDACEKGRH